ncbi:hypothetical protein ACQ4PT_054111 [Festuca glaucescens]
MSPSCIGSHPLPIFSAAHHRRSMSTTPSPVLPLPRRRPHHRLCCLCRHPRFHLVSQANRLLRELREPDQGIPKETAIKILASAGRVEEAAWLFRRAVHTSEEKDPSVHRAMMGLFDKNGRHRSVVEVFDEMRKVGHLPDSETIAITMNAYGKLEEFDKAAVLYRALRQEGCVFLDRVHFQMVSLLGAQQDFEALEQLVGELSVCWRL